MNFASQNIPQELKALRQWVCSGIDKKPLNPRTGHFADVTDASTWGTFNEAVHAGKPNIGFVLTKGDPYCIVDLDDKADSPATEEQRERFAKIMGSLDSYTEISQSGRGTHIVCKGEVPKGVKKDNVEIYSSERYMIFTGNVLHNAPIKEYAQTILHMFSEMEAGVKVMQLEWIAPLVDDEEIYRMAATAQNAEKFYDLWNGDWKKYPEYEDQGQSGADLALFSMLCFYSQSNEQVVRMFRNSKLGERKKASRDEYMIWSLQRARVTLQAPPVDFTNLRIPQKIEPLAEVEQLADIEVIRPPGFPLEFPPGLIGKLADYILTTSNRPVAHISLGAAISLVAGIAGRCFNYSGTGLNHYIMIVAGTGRGKEDAARGINRVMSSVRLVQPNAINFEGPGTFASGQGLIRWVDEFPCFVSVMGEVGITLKQITRPDAHSADVAFRKALLDLYSKSGWTDSLKPSAYSDKDKNTKIIQAPCVSILGEGSTETFYQSLDTTNIADGLIPRFTVISYEGQRTERNENAFQPPSDELTQEVGTLCAVALSSQENQSCSPVACERDAYDILRSFDKKCDALINDAGNQAEAELWNRAHLKSLKLAALISVGVNPMNPTIGIKEAQWAVDFTEWEVGSMVLKFSSGIVGLGDHRQEVDIRDKINQYYKMSTKQRLDYKVGKVLAEHGNVFPLTYLKRRCRMLSSFRNDKRGADAALSSMLKMLCTDGTLQKVPKDQALAEFGTRADIFVLGESWGDD